MATLLAPIMVTFVFRSVNNDPYYRDFDYTDFKD